MSSTRLTFIQPVSVLAILATTAAGVIQGCVVVGLPLAAWVVSLSVVAAVIAVPGMWWAERNSDARAVPLMLVLYLLVTAGALFAGRGYSFLVAMPVASMLVLYLPLPRALVLNVALFACLIFAIDKPEARNQSALGLGSAFAFVVVFSLVARRERVARLEIERLSVELETLAATRERNRIAREIHDSVGHYLTVANVQLEAARATETGRLERIERAQGLLRDGLVELRRSVSMLRETLPTAQPFAQAIEELVAGNSAELRITGTKRLLSGAVGFALYRAAQEGLTNAQRHAAAQRIAVHVEYGDDVVRLEVRDDGRGPSAESSGGTGLAGLRERVELLGGAVQHGAAPGGGFRLQVEVPT